MIATHNTNTPIKKQPKVLMWVIFILVPLFLRQVVEVLEVMRGMLEVVESTRHVP